MDIAPPFNPLTKAVPWYREGGAGQVLSHAIPLGAGVALVGHLTGSRAVFVAGLVLAGYGALVALRFDPLP